MSSTRKTTVITISHNFNTALRALALTVMAAVFVSGCATVYTISPGPPEPVQAVPIIIPHKTNIPLQEIAPDSLLTDYAPTSYPHPQSPWVDSVMAALTLREKLAQMIVPFAFSDITPQKRAALKTLIKQYKVGGVIISKGSVRDAVDLITEAQSWSELPLLISADFENGLSMRLTGATEFPPLMALGATRNPDLAYAMARAVADEARAIGVYQNYAPVADVNNNPNNPIINVRSFGESPTLVATMAEAYMRGLQDGRVIATAKHFPGHGDTESDSHFSTPVLPWSRGRLDSIELYPFRRLIDGGVLSVMSGHLSVPSLENDSTVPATLSIPLIDSLLRGAMGFKGIVVTDAMNMKGLTKSGNSGRAAVRAVGAGVDVLLMPDDVPETIDSLFHAVGRGELSEERIQRSVRRILSYKQWLGLCDNRFPDTSAIRTMINSEEHRILAQTIAREALTLVKNDSVGVESEEDASIHRPLLPLRIEPDKRVVSLAFVRSNGTVDAAHKFCADLKTRIPSLETYYPDEKITKRERTLLANAIRNADVLIVSSFIQIRTGSANNIFSADQRTVLEELRSCEKPLALLSFGSPYILSALPSATAYLCAYGADAASLTQAARVLFGEDGLQGALPVTIPGLAAYGTSLRYSVEERHATNSATSTTDSTTQQPADSTITGEQHQPVSAAEPEHTLQRHISFNNVDGLIDRQIRKRSFPGAQLYVFEHGTTYARSYGAYTYDTASQKVTDSTLYDLASVSKVVATTSAVMKLYEEGRLHLDDTVANFIPAFGKNGKSRITIRNLLVHNSGLVGFRLYYTILKDSAQLLDTIFGEHLTYPTGTATVYSDLGMITLAKVIEKITGMPLDAYVAQTFFRPMRMTHTLYRPPDSLKAFAVPTELDTYWRKRLVQGTVHDENAALLNGVAGHAGLFSTASDLARFCTMLMNGGELDGVRYLQKSTIELFTRRQKGSASRALGWDTKSSRASSAGKYYSSRSFGHTGFTGTSIWIDPDAEMFVIFLTNRVHPTRDNRQLISFRPVLHDAIREAGMEK